MYGWRANEFQIVIKISKNSMKALKTLSSCKFRRHQLIKFVKIRQIPSTNLQKVEVSQISHRWNRDEEEQS